MYIPRAAIFDMDGLLIDSEPYWRLAHIEVVAKYGVSISEDDVRQMAGRRTDEVVEYWRNVHNIKVSGKDLEKEVVSTVLKSIRLHGKELPGVRHVISLLEQHGLVLALASSSSPEIIEAVLDKLKLAEHFATTYSAKFEEYGKPHPGVFITTAKKLGIETNECLVLEDALSGIRAAKAAGMKCIAVPEKVNFNHSEFKSEADIVLASLNDVKWETITELYS